MNDNVAAGGRIPASALTLLIDGDLDLATVDTWRRRLSSTLTEAFDAVVVDLAATAFIDSSGVGALITMRRDTEAAGRQFTLRNVSDRFLRLLQITGLGGWFPIEAATT